jgi:methyl-accepting chemotaxis protein
VYPLTHSPADAKNYEEVAEMRAISKGSVFAVCLIAMVIGLSAIAGESPKADKGSGQGSGSLPPAGRAEDPIQAAEVSERLFNERERSFLASFAELRRLLDEQGPFTEAKQKRTVEELEKIVVHLRAIAGAFREREPDLLTRLALYKDSLLATPAAVRAAATQLRTDAQKEREDARGPALEVAAALEKIAKAVEAKRDRVGNIETDLKDRLDYMKATDRILAKVEGALGVLKNSAAGGAELEATVKLIDQYVSQFAATTKAISDLAKKLEEPVPPNVPPLPK